MKIIIYAFGLLKQSKAVVWHFGPDLFLFFYFGVFMRGFSRQCNAPTSHAFSSGRMASEQTKSDLMSVEIINYENFNLVTCTITILILAMMIDCVHMISIKGYM